MNDTYGHMYGMPFARWDHDTQSWRTSEDTSLLDLPMSSLTLPKSGGMRNGQLLQRQTLALPIYESVSSSLPTPTARDYKDTTVQPAKHRPLDTDTLNRAIAHLLPTPTVNDMGAGKDPQKWQEWTEEMRQKHGNGNGHGRSLEQEAVSLLPTPRAQDEYERRNHKTMERIRDKGGDMTLPTWAKVVAPLLGKSTSQPSDVGNTSSDDQHPTLQLWDQQADHD
jgi:hypothetical protein